MASEEKVSSKESQLVHTSETASADKNVESRLNKLAQDTMNQTVERFLQNIKMKIFKKTYPEIYKENKTHLYEIHKQFLIQLKDSFLDEAKEICNASNLQASFYLLDSLITKYEDRIGKKSWRPSGTPSNDLRDHLHQVKLKQKKCLEFQLQTLITENESVDRILREKHQEILNKKSNIESINEDFKKNLQGINAETTDHFENEINLSLENCL